MAKQKQIDWEQRRYEMAKNLLPVMLVLDNMSETVISYSNAVFREDSDVSFEEVVVDRTLGYVDEMLRQLKHTELGIDIRDEEYYKHMYVN